MSECLDRAKGASKWPSAAACLNARRSSESGSNRIGEFIHGADDAYAWLAHHVRINLGSSNTRMCLGGSKEPSDCLFPLREVDLGH